MKTDIERLQEKIAKATIHALAIHDVQALTESITRKVVEGIESAVMVLGQYTLLKMAYRNLGLDGPGLIPEKEAIAAAVRGTAGMEQQLMKAALSLIEGTLEGAILKPEAEAYLRAAAEMVKKALCK